MQFTTAILALLPAMGLAAAVPAALPQAGNAAGSNQCDVSTFNDGADLSIDEAPVDDCNALIAQINPTQTWSVAKSWARLETWGQCEFG
jgi:hypothetical protein